MCCSVVFGIRLRLIVINISTSPPQSTLPRTRPTSDVSACETVAVVHWRPCLQHLACCSVNTGSQARYRLRIAISAYPTCIRRPVRGGGFPLEYCYAVWHGITRMMWLPDGEKILMLCLFILKQSMNVTDRQTDTHRDRHRMIS